MALELLCFSLARSDALSLKSTTALSSSYTCCSGQSVYCWIFCQSCVRSRRGRLLLDTKDTSRSGFVSRSIRYSPCQDKRSGRHNRVPICVDHPLAKYVEAAHIFLGIRMVNPDKYGIAGQISMEHRRGFQRCCSTLLPRRDIPFRAVTR
jgi:hypothetical protein